MEMYLIKSAACLTILLVFYKVFLEKESMHTFKRFYLLFALGLSFYIPLLTFTHYIEVAPSTNLQVINTVATSNIQLIEEEPSIINWLNILWTIYALGVIFFGIRFLLNLSMIANRIRRNATLKNNNFINVLMTDYVIPHTFFNYIFLNKSKFERKEIPEEVLLHEQTHASQKHSIDILIIELLQIICWFNPLIYLMKKAIKLNHEFLADRAVVNQGVSPTTYQELLLAFSSNAAEPLPIDIGMANAINYSSIKKRFTVMKTQTSKKNVWIKSFILLPLLAIMVYGFSTTKEIEKEVEPQIKNYSTTKHTARSIDLKILKDSNYLVNDIKATKKTLATVVNTLHKDITPEIRNNIMNIHVSSTKEVSNNEVWFIYNTLLDYGFYRIVTPNQEVVKGKGNTPFKMTNVDTKDSPEISAQQSASREQMKEYNKLAKHYNAMLKKKDVTIKMSDAKRLEYIYSIMSKKQRMDAEPFPNFPIPPPAPEVLEIIEEEVPNAPPPPPIHENATPAQRAKYKAVIAEYAKKHPESISKIKTPDGELVEVVEIPNDALNIQPPPPPPPLSKTDVKTGYKEINGQTHYFVASSSKTRYFNRWGVEVDEKGNEYHGGKQTKSNDVIPGQYVSKVYKDGKVISEFDTTGAPPPPPPPPAPPTMEDMAKKGAAFYLEGKRISAEEAIKIVNKNKDINIQILGVNSKRPKVKLSKKGYTHKKTKAKEQANINLETGNIKINGKEHLYAKKDGHTSYLNENGNLVDKNGEALTGKAPKFYYNGQHISSRKAHKLLSKNTSSLSVSTKNNTDGSYKVLLSDTNRTYNNINRSNSNPNSNNRNLNENHNKLNNNQSNPNSVIDLTEVISKGATFFYENKKISTEKALMLTRSNDIERVQTKQGQDGKPEVYFWKKA